MVFNQLVNKEVEGDPLSVVFAALADPTRRSILARLSEQDATVGELAAPYQMSLPAISKHLKVLEKAGLVTKVKDAQSRHCHLEVARLKEATDWLENYRLLWEERLGNLDVYLQQVQSDSPEKE